LRIVYVVDVHGRFDSVLGVLEPIDPIDVLVIGGDITTGGRPHDAEQAIELWRPLAPRLLAVAGNMDSREIDERLVELGVSIDGRGVTIDGVGFFGASAAPLSPLHTPHEVAEEELAQRAERGLADVSGAALSIFCPHAPPHGTVCDRLRSGEHVGSTAVRAFVEREQPNLVLSGHIHEARGRDSIGQTIVANPGPVGAGHYALVEVADRQQRPTLTLTLV
jgi:uncharacterized protein